MNTSEIWDGLFVLKTSIEDVSAAIREQTEYFKEDDAKENRIEQRVGGILRAPTSFNVEGHKIAEQVRKLTGTLSRLDQAEATAAFNPNTERQKQDLPEVSRDKAYETIVILQETPHQFLKWADNYTKRCRLCRLARANPVHNILLPEFPSV